MAGRGREQAEGRWRALSRTGERWGSIALPSAKGTVQGTWGLLGTVVCRVNEQWGWRFRENYR